MRSLAAFVLAALAACSAYPGEGCVGDAPDAPWLAFASNRTGNYEIFVARADGSCVRQVTDDPAQDLYPSFGPAGRIAYRSDRNLQAGIRIHDLPTGQDWALEVGTLAATAPAYSPDGRRIAFEARSPGSATSDVFVVPAAGGVPTRLTDDLSDDAGPAWSPDGATIYFVSTRAGPYDVFSVAVTGGAAARVTTGSRIVGKPGIAPDGTALYYSRTVSGATTTEVVRHELGTDAIAVVSSQADSEPAVSPDGSLLALRSFRSGQADLWLASAVDGSGAAPLTTDVASDGAPSFAPPAR